MIFEKKGLLGKKDELCLIVKYFAAARTCVEGSWESLWTSRSPCQGPELVCWELCYCWIQLGFLITMDTLWREGGGPAYCQLVPMNPRWLSKQSGQSKSLSRQQLATWQPGRAWEGLLLPESRPRHRTRAREGWRILATAPRHREHSEDLPNQT